VLVASRGVGVEVTFGHWEMAVLAGVVVGFVAAVESSRRADESEKREAVEGPCVDSATLVATSSGSPSSTQCVNKRHKMRVQVTSIAGNEVGAVVHCECQPEAGGR
jgi:hypothetical protein